jgi:YaiO family outer membrane protein
MNIPVLILALALAGAAIPCLAEPARPTTMIEVGLERARVSDDYGDWMGRYIRGTHESGADVFYGELIQRHAFSDQGAYASFGNTHTWSPDWFSSVFIGGGQDSDLWPSLRLDASLSRKWLSRRQLVTSAGVSYLRAHDEHRDYALTLGGQYYFDGPWIIEGGARHNRSHPGDVQATSYYSALTYGRYAERYLVIRLDSGREAYQMVGDNPSLVDFSSDAVSLTWREWLRRDFGFNLALTHYQNTAYTRDGASFGLFVEF